MEEMLQVVQAFDRAPIAEILADDAATLDAKLERAAQALRDRDGWLKPHQRTAILQRTADLMQERQEDFTRLIAREGGKPWKDAKVEVIRAIDSVRSAAEELRTFHGREIPMGLTPASDGRWAFTTKEPIGVVASISAFNHPLNLVVHQVAPAVAVGCPVIVKPAPVTPLCCIEFVKLLHEAGLDERWCQTFITADNALAERLATDPRVAFVSFIGSAKVGWYLRSKLPPGTRCALEHGGAAPVIVDKSAKIERILDPIAKGGYYHSGQVCVSVQRIFVENGLLSEFTERFAAKVAELRIGDPLSPETDAGPLILPRETTRVQAWIDEAAKAGTRVIGGGRLSETTLLPAILVEPPVDAKVSTLEIFGPVTCLYGFDSLDDAIARANALPYAFQSSIFSTDIGPALRAAQRFDAAAVLINDHTAFRVDWMPFAGLRQSGYRTGGIPYTMEDMSIEKMIVMRLDA